MAANNRSTNHKKTKRKPRKPKRQSVSLRHIGEWAQGKHPDLDFKDAPERFWLEEPNPNSLFWVETGPDLALEYLARNDPVAIASKVLRESTTNSENASQPRTPWTSLLSRVHAQLLRSGIKPDLRSMLDALKPHDHAHIDPRNRAGRHVHIDLYMDDRSKPQERHSVAALADVRGR
jgi:hypothetical protein